MSHEHDTLGFFKWRKNFNNKKSEALTIALGQKWKNIMTIFVCSKLTYFTHNEYKILNHASFSTFMDGFDGWKIKNHTMRREKRALQATYTVEMEL